jgi:hypothetical protein
MIMNAVLTSKTHQTLVHASALSATLLAMLCGSASAADGMDQARALIQPWHANTDRPAESSPGLDAHVQAVRLIRIPVEPTAPSDHFLALAGVIVDAHQQARDLIQPHAPAAMSATHRAAGVEDQAQAQADGSSPVRARDTLTPGT